MQVQRQFRRSPGQVLVLMLAFVAAAMLGGSAGYGLRAAGFPQGGSATPVSAPAPPKAHYYEPDAGDRPTPTQTAAGYAPTTGSASEQHPTHGAVP
jgi:hypothetical protein